MQVKQPSTEQALKTKMAEGKEFVVYYGTGQIDALPGDKVVPWGAKAAPAWARGTLLKALQSAEEAIATGAPV